MQYLHRSTDESVQIQLWFDLNGLIRCRNTHSVQADRATTIPTNISPFRKLLIVYRIVNCVPGVPLWYTSSSLLKLSHSFDRKGIWCKVIVLTITTLYYPEQLVWAGLLYNLTVTKFTSVRTSSGILHHTAVKTIKVMSSHWLSNGECILVNASNSIYYHPCLLVGCIGSDHSSILCPCDSGSRSTSGGAGEGLGLSVKCKLSDVGGTCMPDRTEIRGVMSI